VAAGLREGDVVQILATVDAVPVDASIVAIDARIDETTRNALIRARLNSKFGAVVPGASVRVRVPAGEERSAVSIPVNALRKGPGGDHVFVIAPDEAGHSRAHVRTVQSGAMIGDEILVLEGLAAGEVVAASGSFKLQEGALVAIAEPASPATDEIAEPAQPSDDEIALPIE
jgi:membrane fusion protein (multidrug efflux system)